MIQKSQSLNHSTDSAKICTCCSKEDGGLKMKKVQNFVESLKIEWVKRYCDSNNKGKWKIIFCKDIIKIGGKWIWLLS